MTNGNPGSRREEGGSCGREGREEWTDGWMNGWRDGRKEGMMECKNDS